MLRMIFLVSGLFLARCRLDNLMIIGWTKFMEKNEEGETEIVGDDLTVTNVERVKLAQEKGACNGLLLKINQIGTITEAITAYDFPSLSTLKSRSKTYVVRIWHLVTAGVYLSLIDQERRRMISLQI